VKAKLGPLVFSAVRSLENLLPPQYLYWTLTPFACARAALERSEASLPVPDCLPNTTSVSSPRRERISFHLNRVIKFFPDRVASAKWQKRCRINGLEHVQRAREKGRPVVLVFFHFGLFEIIPFWLRAVGIPVVTLLGERAEERSLIRQMKDQLSPFPDLPTVVHRNKLRDVLSVLSTGNVLYIAADTKDGKQMDLAIDDRWSFQMATGAIRLASRYDAELVPCCMIDEGRWRFRLEIGRPVPREFLVEGSDMIAAGEYLLREALAHMRRHPAQCTSTLVERFRQNVPAALAEKSST
jgi:lauroyl/myristoyl acyltransferase